MAWYHRYIIPAEEHEAKKAEERRLTKRETAPADYPIATGEPTGKSQNLPMLIALLVAALALAVLIGLLISWAVNHGSNQAPAPAQTKNLPAPPPTNLQSGTKT